jgi:hypothetical protein
MFGNIIFGVYRYCNCALQIGCKILFKPAITKYLIGVKFWVFSMTDKVNKTGVDIQIIISCTWKCNKGK